MTPSSNPSEIHSQTTGSTDSATIRKENKLKNKIINDWIERGLSIPRNFDSKLSSVEFIKRFLIEVSVEIFGLDGQVHAYLSNTPEKSLTDLLSVVNDEDNFDLLYKLPKVKVPKVEVPKVKVPKVNFSKVKFLKVKVPKVKVPEVKVPEWNNYYDSDETERKILADAKAKILADKKRAEKEARKEAKKLLEKEYSESFNQACCICGQPGEFYGEDQQCYPCFRYTNRFNNDRDEIRMWKGL